MLDKEKSLVSFGKGCKEFRSRVVHIRVCDVDDDMLVYFEKTV
jgi:hypothetical protein